MRETGQAQPRLLRDPKRSPFGYVPPEGLKITPPPAPGRRAGAPAEGRRGSTGADKEQRRPPTSPRRNRPTRPSEVTTARLHAPLTLDLSLDLSEVGRQAGEGAFVG